MFLPYIPSNFYSHGLPIQFVETLTFFITLRLSLQCRSWGIIWIQNGKDFQENYFYESKLNNCTCMSDATDLHTALPVNTLANMKWMQHIKQYYKVTHFSEILMAAFLEVPFRYKKTWQIYLVKVKDKFTFFLFCQLLWQNLLVNLLQNYL